MSSDLDLFFVAFSTNLWWSVPGRQQFDVFLLLQSIKTRVKTSAKHFSIAMLLYKEIHPMKSWNIYVPEMPIIQ